jgi:hypothetical protein
MIRGPGQAVNDGLPPHTAALPPVRDFDIALSIRNVESWGGEPTLYQRFLALALAADEVDGGTDGPLPHTVLTVAALSAWRSGALDLRADALARLGEALGSGSIPRPALAGALGLAPSELDDFVRAQAESPFGWPARGDGDVVVARVGGFRGLGGPWTAPPLRGEPGEHEGRFVITLTDGERWQLDADIFCTALTRVSSGAEDASGTAVSGPRDRPVASGAWPTRLAVFDTSYLAWLVLETSR